MHRPEAEDAGTRRGRAGPTIKDVAREAGVSVATVSRVLNNSGPVRPATRERIQRVTERLRYMPNLAARSLITSRTHTLGVLLPDLYGEFFSEVIRGIDQAAYQSGYHLLVSNSHNLHSGLELAIQSMRGRVDGFIMMSPSLPVEGVVESIPEGVPVILLNCRTGETPFQALNIDNYAGAFAMTRHLLEHGHRRVALIRGADDNHDAEERLRGYRDAMRELGGEWREDLELGGDFSDVTGYRAALRALDLAPRPTALFAANDAMAIGALSALREAGVRVPEEVAVAGFDDIPIARYIVPPLSTVHVSINELGARACRRLLAVVEGEGDGGGRQEVLPTRLVLRGSCGCTG